MMETLQALIMEVEQNASLERPRLLRERTHAMDRLEDHLVHAPSHDDTADTSPQAQLYRRARALHARLEEANRRLCQAIRDDIQRGLGAKALRAWAGGPHGYGDSYDHLDTLLSGILQLQEPTAEIAALGADMVFYQPTPARHILDLIDRAAIDHTDVLIDLGSGLGHVPLLVSICTGAQCIGIEREPVYAESARCSARTLNLDQVTFITQDARDGDLSRGTVFYLYTPFTGTLLRTVLDMLKREAASRPIRIGTLGPCTPVVAAESWLEAVAPQDVDRITLFHPSRGRAGRRT
jgi:Histone methylation protein DOT1